GFGQLIEADVALPTSPPHAVPADVEGDLVEPRRETSFLLERPEAAIGLEQRLLAQVTHVFSGSHQPVDGPLDLSLPAADEHVEGRRVPILELFHQLLIARRHRPRELRRTGHRCSRYSVL